MPLGANRITLLAFQATVAAAAEVIRKKVGISATSLAVIVTADSKFSGSSFDSIHTSSNSHLTIKKSDFSRFNTGTGAFTVEGWFKPTSAGADGNSRFFYFGGTVNGANSFGCAITTGGGIFRGPNTGDLNFTKSNTGWLHYAFVYDGTNKSVYCDGTRLATTAASLNITDSTDIKIGSHLPDSRYNFDGYIDELRVSDVARYTGTSYSVPTTTFVNDDDTILLLHMDGSNGSQFFDDDNGVGRSAVGLSAIGNAQIDTTRSKFGGSSALFDGTGDYLRTGSAIDTNSIFWRYEGSWTVELFFNVDTDPNDDSAFLHCQGTGSGNAYTSFIIWRNLDQKIQSNFVARNSSGSGGVQTLGGIEPTVLALDTWHHAVIQYDSVNQYFDVYINGTRTRHQAVTITNPLWGDTGQFGIGASYTGALPFNRTASGWIDEVRISSVARYSGATITVPTAPFVNDSDTLFLTHMDGTDGSNLFLDDNGVVPSSTEGTAVEFDGTNDYYQATSISTSASDNQYLLFACTFYRGSSTNLQHLFNLRLGTGSSDYGFWVWINGGRTQIKMVSGTGSNPTSIYENTENSFTLNDWNQVVVWWNTSDYANSKIFVNGEQKAFSNEGTTSVNWNWGNTATTIKIGELNSSQTTTGADFNGKVSQLYISNPSSFPGIEKFYNTGPLDLGTTGTKTGLASPLIYHYGDTSTFISNNGTGFASYTLTGNGNFTSATADLPQLYNVRQKVGVSAEGDAQIDTAQYQFSGSSALFDGTGDYLELGVQANELMPAGSHPWTVECWFRPAVLNQFHGMVGMYLQSNGGRATFRVSDTNYIAFFHTDMGSITGTTQSLSANTWYHLAWCSDGTTMRMFVNGVQDGTDTVPSTLDWSPVNVHIGDGNLQNGSQSIPANGHIDEVRISNTARYTAAFTPDTTPFQNDANTLLLLHMDGTDGGTDFVDDNGVTTAGQP